MIIFLDIDDIDGVLNQLQRNYYLDDKCIENLGILCKKLSSEVVLTSSWRLGYTNLGKCTPQIENLRGKFCKYNIKIVGRTKNLGNRELEIKEYIKDNNISKYVVIDDDKTEFKNNSIDNIYFVNSKTGIIKKDIKQIVKLYK